MSTYEGFFITALNVRNPETENLANELMLTEETKIEAIKQAPVARIWSGIQRENPEFVGLFIYKENN